MIRTAADLGAWLCFQDQMRQPVAVRPWLTVFQLPPYASELNPVGSVRSGMKRSLVNLTRQNIAQLTVLVKTRLRQVQDRPGLLSGFLARTGLDLVPTPLT